MRILALDLGTKTGWALYSDGAVTSGTWLLATDKELRQRKKAKLDRCCEIRFNRLRENLLKLMKAAPDFIYFEDVQFLSSQAQSQLWAGFRTVVSLYHPVITIRAVPVGTLKKFATGNGAATKEMMLAALVHLSPQGQRLLEKPPGYKMDDNEVDALHLLQFALEEQKTQCTTQS